MYHESVSRLVTWLPPVAWTAVVLTLSSASFSADNTGSIIDPLLAWLLPWLAPSSIAVIHGLLRKTAHVTEYAVLAALWWRALARSGARPARAAWLTLLIGVTVAAVDETHQSWLPSRTGSIRDVLIDTAGVALAVALAGLGWRRAADAVTGVLLWVGLAGGLLALVLALAAGVGGGVLWLTVPAAAGALVYRRRKSAAGRA
jgi:VanZ family protein